MTWKLPPGYIIGNPTTAIERLEKALRRAAKRKKKVPPPAGPFLCDYCRAATRRSFHFATCGKTECRREHHRIKDAEKHRELAAKFEANGKCIRCGEKRDRAPAKKTGRPQLRCRACRILHREEERVRRAKRRAKIVAAQTKELAMLRLVAAKIERERTQRARLEAGLGISLSRNVRLPKQPPPKMEI